MDIMANPQQLHEQPKAEEKPSIPPLYNVVNWNFSEYQFKCDTDFEDPGIPERYVLRAIEDGFLRAK
jgi:hypothetical protein